MKLHSRSILAASLMALACCFGCSLLQAGDAVPPDESGPPPSPRSEPAPQNADGQENGREKQETDEAEDDSGDANAVEKSPQSGDSPSRSGGVPRAVPLSGGRRSLTTALSNATEQLKNRSRQVDQLRSKLAETKEKLGKRNQKIEQLEKKLEERRSRIEKLKKAVAEWKKDVIGFRNEMRSAEEAQMQALQQIIALLRRSRGGSGKGDSEKSEAGEEAADGAEN